LRWEWEVEVFVVSREIEVMFLDAASRAQILASGDVIESVNMMSLSLGGLTGRSSASSQPTNGF
jgi:hypothetical protein